MMEATNGSAGGTGKQEAAKETHRHYSLDMKRRIVEEIAGQGGSYRNHAHYQGATMDNLLSVTFEAHHPERNHHRRYQVTVGRDLLDDWTVAIGYGRTGQAGRELRYAAADPEALRAIIRDRLRRRLSALRRIGCPYRLAALHAAPGFDPNAWLPGDVMARFFSQH